jgi:hypothetical protein
MAVIVSGNHPKALWPGVKEWFGLAYNEIPTQYTEAFKTETSDKSFEEMVEATGFGLAPVKAEGSAISYDSHTQQSTTRFTNVVYGLGYIVTREELEDNKYAELSRGRSAALKFSMRQTKEVVHANVFNRAFSSSYLGGDGKELCATDHPVVAGTQSNELNPGADFSEAALEDLLVQISNARNSRGLRIALTGKKLLVPPELQFTANRVVNSVLRPGTANNDVNAMRHMGMVPDGVFVWQYLDQTDDWVVKTDCPAGMISFQRRKLELEKDNDFDTENAKAKATERYVPGWGDWRSVYGSVGA